MSKPVVQDQTSLTAATNKGRLDPSPDDLRLFHALVSVLKPEVPNVAGSGSLRPTDKYSLRSLAESVGHPSSTVSDCLRRLEQFYSKVAERPITLLHRGKHAAITSADVTKDGDVVFLAAGELLTHHTALQKWAPQNPFQPGPATTSHIVHVGTTHSTLIHLLPWPVAAFRAKHPDVAVIPKEGEPDELLRMLRSGEIDFAVGPMPRNAEPGRYEGVILDDLRCPIDIVVVTHPDDLLAKDHFRNGELDAEGFESLANRRVYVLRELHTHVGVRLPVAVRPAFESYFSTVLAFVEMASGVGIVPGWYERLDRFARLGRLEYATCKTMKPFPIALYLPHKGDKGLRSVQAKQLVDEVRSELKGSPHRRSWNPGSRQEAAFPKTLAGTWHQYFVSCHPRTPRWHSGTMVFTRKGKTGSYTGIEKNFDASGDTNRIVREYDVSAILDDTLLSYTAVSRHRDKKEKPDRYAAVFTVALRDDCLLGAWVGRDDGDMPTAAQIILSRKPLNEVPRECQAAVREGMMRFIPDGDLRSLPSRG